MTNVDGNKSVAEELAEFVQLDNIISQRQERFYQLVKEQIKEIEVLKDLKKGLHELDLTNKVNEGTQETQEENEAEQRVRENLDLVAKLKRELDNLHLERLLDLSRAKILKALGIGSWQRLKEKATESGKAPHDYIFASLKENPIKNGETLPVKAIEMLCTKSFINLGNIYDIEEAYISCVARSRAAVGVMLRKSLTLERRQEIVAYWF